MAIPVAKLADVTPRHVHDTGAGDKLLYMLERMDVKNTLVVVTRWYGGIQLGPDRFKHITGCAKQVAPPKPMTRTRHARDTHRTRTTTRTRTTDQPILLRVWLPHRCQLIEEVGLGSSAESEGGEPPGSKHGGKKGGKGKK